MGWDDYDVFCHVVEHGGFTAAAQALGRPKSSLSASVIRLEERLQTRLLERTTRRLRLTEAGEMLHNSISTLFASLREVHSETLSQGKGVTGTLRIAAPYELASVHLSPVICSVMQRHSTLKVELDVQHASVNPLEQGYDLAFAMLEAPLPASMMVVRRMFSLKRALFASPDFLATRPRCETPEQLAQWPLLVGPHDTQWRLKAGQGGADHIPVSAPRMISANAQVRLQAAVAGLGVVRLTTAFAAQEVQAGRLRPLLTEYECDPMRIYALLPAKRLMPEKVRLFLNALQAQVQVQQRTGEQDLVE